MPTPEEIAAFKAKLMGAASSPVAGAGPQLAAKLAGDGGGDALRRAGESAYRLTHSAPLSTINPLAVAAQQLEPTGAAPARQMQSFKRDAPPEELLPMYTPAEQVQTVAPLATPGQAPKRGGGGGGGSSGPSLYSEWRAARSGQLGDFDTDKRLAGQLGENRSDRIDYVSQLQIEDAAHKQRDAEIDLEKQAEAEQKHQAFLSRNTELADEIGRQKVDPKRLVRGMDTGEKINHVLGSALGGFAAGLSGGPNDFLDRFDKKVSQDIQAQMDETDNKKASLSARNSVFGQMLAETGSRQQAAMQTRNLMYESAKQYINARADQLGIPEVKTQAAQQISAIQHQQDQLNAQLKGEDYQRQQAAAAAAAAAQKAAEKDAWERSKWVAEYGLKKDELAIKAGEVGKDARKEDASAIAETTKRLADDDVVKNKDLIESLSRKVDKDGNVVGHGLGAKLRGALLGKRIGLSDEERIGQQEYDQLLLAYKNKVTGSGGSDSEAAKIQAAFEGAGSMAEKKRAIDMAKADLARREGLAQASLTDEQKATLQQRLAREGQSALPSSVKVKSGNLSDERAKRFATKIRGY